MAVIGPRRRTRLGVELQTLQSAGAGAADAVACGDASSQRRQGGVDGTRNAMSAGDARRERSRVALVVPLTP